MSFFERLKTAASAEWRAYTEHPFTNGLADGTLAEAAFRHYLVQDYLFLTELARAYALSVYKSPKLADMREAAAGLSAILDIEMNLHLKLCAGWGLSPSDLEQTPPAVEMLAYKVVKLLSLEVEDIRAKDDRYEDAATVEYFSVHDLPPIEGPPRQRLRLLGSDSETNRTRAISPSPSAGAPSPIHDDHATSAVSLSRFATASPFA